MENPIVKIAIIGTGWYGCYIAEYLLNNYSNIEIIMIDKKSSIFTGSSYNNQNRLHLGFHYPRCSITQNKSKKYHELFLNKYNDSIELLDKNYYAIANNSYVDYENYLNLYDKNDYILIKNDFLENISGNIINTKEKYINFKKIKLYYERLLNNKVKFIFDHNVKNISQINNKVLIDNNYEFDKVFNCTYNQINDGNNNVIYEKCLTLIYNKINSIPFDSLTIMDGEYCSLYKYENDLFSLTDVKHTPLIKSERFIDVKDFNDYDLNEKKLLFEENICKFYSDFHNNFSYTTYYESYKCKQKSNTDNRDINITIDNNIMNIWCGKISFIFELDNYISSFI